MRRRRCFHFQGRPINILNSTIEVEATPASSVPTPRHPRYRISQSSHLLNTDFHAGRAPPPCCTFSWSENSRCRPRRAVPYTACRMSDAESLQAHTYARSTFVASIVRRAQSAARFKLTRRRDRNAPRVQPLETLVFDDVFHDCDQRRLRALEPLHENLQPRFRDVHG